MIIDDMTHHASSVAVAFRAFFSVGVTDYTCRRSTRYQVPGTYHVLLAIRDRSTVSRSTRRDQGCALVCEIRVRSNVEYFAISIRLTYELISRFH
jgi:hypothetical protein